VRQLAFNFSRGLLAVAFAIGLSMHFNTSKDITLVIGAFSVILGSVLLTSIKIETHARSPATCFFNEKCRFIQRSFNPGSQFFRCTYCPKMQHNKRDYHINMIVYWLLQYRFS